MLAVREDRDSLDQLPALVKHTAAPELLHTVFVFFCFKGGLSESAVSTGLFSEERCVIHAFTGLMQGSGDDLCVFKHKKMNVSDILYVCMYVLYVVCIVCCHNTLPSFNNSPDNFVMFSHNYINPNLSKNIHILKSLLQLIVT